MIAIPERGIYLASRSPRRRELLAQIGVRFHLLLFRERLGEHPEVDETPLAGEAPAAYVERMARAKAEAGWRRMLQRNLPPAPILASAVLACMYEGWTDSADAAERAIRSGSITLAPAQEHRCVTPLAALVSPRTSMVAVHDRAGRAAPVHAPLSTLGAQAVP